MDIHARVLIATAIYDSFSSVDKVIASRLVIKFLSGDFTELSSYFSYSPKGEIKLHPTDSLTSNAVVTESKKKGHDVS